MTSTKLTDAEAAVVARAKARRRAKATPVEKAFYGADEGAADLYDPADEPDAGAVAQWADDRAAAEATHTAVAAASKPAAPSEASKAHQGTTEPPNAAESPTPDATAPPDDTEQQADGQPRREVTVSDVFDNRESLRSIRDNARNAGEAPFAVLAAVIIRVLVATPPALTLPGMGARSTPGSLNMYAAVAAPSGGGKGEVMAMAENCVIITDTHGKRVDIPVEPPGSGEGLVAKFTMPADPEVMPTTRVLFDVDEITNLTALSGRTGATLQPTLLSMWSGKTVGNTNASAATSRRVEGGTYRIGIIAGVQPSNAGALLNEAGSGLPQRFLWASMADPGVDLTTPAAPPVQVQVPAFDDPARSVNVCPEVRAALCADKVNKRKGMYPHPWDSHALQCREIIAVALSLLDGRDGDVTADDWHLAALIWQHNRDTRFKCLQGSRSQATEVATERERVRTEARDQVGDDRMDRAREVIAQALTEGNGRFHRSRVRNGKARRCRTEFDDILNEMIEARELALTRDQETGAEWVTDVRDSPE